VKLPIWCRRYLEKPFGRKELLARVRALPRRAPRNAAPASASAIGGSSSIHGRTPRADRGAGLTPTEFRLLAALAARSGAVDRGPAPRGLARRARPRSEWLKAHPAGCARSPHQPAAPVPANVRGVGYKFG
jgi:two-component system response regulator MprA